MGPLAFRDGINNLPIKFAKAISKLLSNYHWELEVILLSLKYTGTINFIGIRGTHFQAITSTKQQESFNDINEEIKRISNELRAINIFFLILILNSMKKLTNWPK